MNTYLRIAAALDKTLDDIFYDDVISVCLIKALEDGQLELDFDGGVAKKVTLISQHRKIAKITARTALYTLRNLLFPVLLLGRSEARRC